MAFYCEFTFDESVPLSSPAAPVIAGLFYLLMALVLPKFVPKDGFAVNGVLVAHNFFLSMASLVLCVGPLYFWSYAFYISKYYEMFDTVLVILKASRFPHKGLHVYHHAVVPVLIWAWLYYKMTLQHVGLVLNAGVHVAMYAYYGFQAMRIPMQARGLDHAASDAAILRQHPIRCRGTTQNLRGPIGRPLRRANCDVCQLCFQHVAVGFVRQDVLVQSEPAKSHAARNGGSFFSLI
eukprot:s3260_g1.t1